MASFGPQRGTPREGSTRFEHLPIISHGMSFFAILVVVGILAVVVVCFFALYSVTLS